jgi:ABC-type antimicrobial peptide transport system permease subunit
MASFLAILGMVTRRSVANRRLLATVVVGVVLSTALMASVVLYSDAIRDLGLKHTLHSPDPLTLDLRVVTSSQRLDRKDHTDQVQKSDGLIRDAAGDVIDSTVRYGRTATFFLTAPGGLVPTDDQRPRAHFQFVQRLDEHVRLVEGRAPKAAGPPGDASAPPTLEVWLGKAGADHLNVRVGDTFDLHPFWKLQAAPVKVVVVGLIEPRDANEPYWFGRPGRFDETTTTWPTYAFFIGEDTAVDALATYLPDIDATIETYVYIDLGRINSGNARSVEDRLRGLDESLRKALPLTSMTSDLPKTIASYREKLFFTRLPLFALMLQVVGIVLYYLVMVATMLVERQAGEIALLKSRGASSWQVMAVYGIEGLVLCAGATVLGPFVAVMAIGILGLTPPFQDLSGGDLLSVPLSTQGFGLAALGAALALAAMLWPAYRAARYSIIDYKHQLARPPQQPLFLRYYLDLALIGAGAFAFYELRQRGSLVTERLFGDLSADPLLLLSPTLFMLMMALVFLRLFPLGLRVVAWAARGLNGPTVALGLWRMVRNPLHYSRLILLLLLATAVGMFAAGFRATLDRSYGDRAAYAAGAPARVEAVRSPVNLPNDTFTAAVRSASGATDVSPVARISGSYSPAPYRSEDLTMLGVVPGEFERLAFWRDDFAGESLTALLGRLKLDVAPPEVGVEVPVGARYLGVWAQVPLAPSVAQIAARLRDSEGTFWDYRFSTTGPLGSVPPPGTWQFFVTDLARPALPRTNPGPPGPLTAPRWLDALTVRLTGNAPALTERMSVLFADVQVWTEATLPPDWDKVGFSGGRVIESFDEMVRYEPVTGATVVSDEAAVSRSPVSGRPNPYAARVAFTRQRGASLPVVGLRLRAGPAVLPVIVSQSFLDMAKKRTGDEVTVYLNRQYVRLRITGSFDLFPTYTPGGGRNFVVADLAALQMIAARAPVVADNVFVNEAWMARPTGGLDKDALVARGLAAEHVFDREALRAAAAADPLIAASWEGILFLSFGAVLALTALGFAVYVTLAAQARALEFAILRTMGFSSRQILSLVTFEQAFVIVGGVVVGTLLGFPLGRLMIGYLGVTETGKDPVPPLLSQVSMGALASVYSLLALVFVGTIGALATVYSRLAVARALRIGEI